MKQDEHTPNFDAGGHTDDFRQQAHTLLSTTQCVDNKHAPRQIPVLHALCRPVNHTYTYIYIYIYIIDRQLLNRTLPHFSHGVFTVATLDTHYHGLSAELY